MTPKEKATELVNLFFTQEIKYYNDINTAKEFALISVDEIVKSKQLRYLFTEEQIDCMEGTSDSRWIYDTFMEYWEEVQGEIKKI